MAVKILIIAKYPEGPSTLVGLRHSLNQLQVEGKCIYSIQGLTVKEEMIQGVDCLLFSRVVDGKLLPLMECALKLHKQVFYYLDDQLFDMPQHIAGANYYRAAETQEALEQFIAKATAVITCNEWLKQAYEKRFKRNCFVIKPTIEIPEPAIKRDKQGKLTIGFAGNIDYKDSLEQLKTPFIELYKKYKGKIEFEIFGPAVSYVDAIDAIYYPPTYYELYERILQRRQWDIGIAFLEDIPFNNLKYYNKYLEYARFKITGVYSNIPLYRRVITEGVNGLLAQNTEEDWYNQLEKLIIKEELRKQITLKSYDALQEQFLASRGARDFEKLFEVFGLL